MKFAKITAYIGAVLFSGPLIGLIGTVIAMMMAFETMGAEGVTNMTQLSHAISIALLDTVAGLAAGVLGIILIFVALFPLGYRARWFFIYLCLLSILWLISFPIGTVLGIIFLCFLIPKRHEFKQTEQFDSANGASRRG